MGVGPCPAHVEHEWTAAQLEAGILKALEERDFEAVVDVLKVMVAWYPREGVPLYDKLKESIVIADFLHGRSRG